MLCSRLPSACSIAFLAATAALPTVAHAQPPGATLQAPYRKGLVVGIGLGAGAGTQADLRLGWMVRPQLALFATALAGTSEADDDYQLVGAGARLWATDLVFFDARAGFAMLQHTNYFDGEVLDVERPNGLGWSAGIGIEGHLGPVGIDLSFATTRVPNGDAYLCVVGGTFY